MWKVIAFLRLGRLHFLAGGFILNALGTTMALYNGAPFSPRAWLWGQVAITATQLMTHYSNDYFDLAADRANRTPTPWSGGSRVLPDGKLPPQLALLTALSLMLIALVALAVLMFDVGTGPLIAPLIVSGLFLSWAYSASPFKLHSRGLGEAATAVIVPGLTPLVGYSLQAGRLDALPILAVFPLCCLQFAMLLIIEFPDAEGDAAVGKNTLVVRLGGERAARLHRWAVLVGYGSLPILVVLGLPPVVALAVLVASPLAVRQLWGMASGAWARPPEWNRMSFIAVGLLIGTSGLELLAFALLVGLA
jgi:1,4-dihydroxy-2-naphthoate polyprenyltransferase